MDEVKEPTPTDIARVRRIAKRRGLVLTKSRRRDRQSPDYGSWWLLDPAQGEDFAVVGDVWGTTLAECEQFLREGGRTSG